MFEDSLAEAGRRSRRSWTFTVSLLSQCLFIAVAVLLPLAGLPELPAKIRSAILLAPPPPRGAPVAAPSVAPASPRVERFQGELTAPRRIPDKVVMDQGPAAAPIIGAAGIAASVPGGVPNGVPGGIALPTAQAPAVPRPPPPPVRPRRVRTPARISIGGVVQAAKLIRRVAPRYPRLARQARISGVVMLKAVIARDGTVQRLEAVSGHPLLIRAALDAVRQWRYEPTLLNGRAVEVETTIRVRFLLR